MILWLGAEWTEEAERKTAGQMRGFFSKENMAEGYRMFLTGNVQGGEWEKKNRYVAEVDDLIEHRTTSVQVDFLPYSRCSCFISGGCPHMAAVLLDAMSSVGIDVDSFLRNQGILQGKVPNARQAAVRTATATARSQAATQTDSPDKAAGGPSELSPHDGYRKWLRTLQERSPTYSGMASGYAQWIEKRLFSLAGHWEDSLRAGAFRIHALLYAVRLSHRTFFERTFTDWQENRKMSDQLVQMLTAQLVSLGQLKTADEELREAAILEIFTIMNQSAVQERNHGSFWLFLYRQAGNLLLSRTLTVKAVREELERRDPYKANKVGDSIYHDMYAHLLLIEQGDEAAMRYLDKLELDNVDDYLVYPGMYAKSKQWDEMSKWMRWLEPFMAHSQYTKEFVAMWEEMAPKVVPFALLKEERLALLSRLLPASLDEYEELLVQQKEYRSWVDLYLHEQLNVEDSDFYARVAKQAPALLPFYHLHADRWTNKKNRTGYQRAVQHLKALKKLYVRMNREREWQMFFRRYSVKHSRLKALQEELRQGGLLS